MVQLINLNAFWAYCHMAWGAKHSTRSSDDDSYLALAYSFNMSASQTVPSCTTSPGDILLDGYTGNKDAWRQRCPKIRTREAYINKYTDKLSLFTKHRRQH